VVVIVADYTPTGRPIATGLASGRGSG